MVLSPHLIAMATLDDKMERRMLKGTVTFSSWKDHTVMVSEDCRHLGRAESRVISRRELRSGITPLCTMCADCPRVRASQEAAEVKDDNTTRQLSSQGSTIRGSDNSHFCLLVTKVHTHAHTR